MSTRTVTPVSYTPRLGHRLHGEVQRAKAAAILDGWVPLWLIVDAAIHDTLMRERHPGYEAVYADWRRVALLPVSVEGGMGWRLVVGPGPVEAHVVEWAKGVVGRDGPAASTSL